MKIQLIEEGWENFTGDFGPIPFVNGISVDDVPPINAERLANLVKVRTIDGSNPSVAQRVLESGTMEMNGEMVFNFAEGTVDGSMSAPQEAPAVDTGWKRETLEAIADDEGIAGLRKISDPMGIKGTSIASLISAILEAQSGAVVAGPVNP